MSTIVARADASVTAARPDMPDHTQRRLRIGGRARWRTLLRFRVAAGLPVARATLKIWSVRRPRGRIIAHATTSSRRWREHRVTYARAPRLAGIAGEWRAPEQACRSPHCDSIGRWLSIDVTGAVRAGRRVELAITATTRRPMQLAGRAKRRHAPRLLVQRDPLPVAPAVVPAPTVAPAPPPPPPAASPAPCTGSAPPATWRHVVWVWLENKDFSQVIGAPTSPYVAALAAQCGIATDNHAIAHPSLPNYIAATSGDPQLVTDNGSPSAHPLAGQSIFDQLGSNWRSYQDGMPANCALTDSGPYVVRHNPAAYYTSARPACMTQTVPLPPDPSFDAAFTFVMPDMCHSTHDCPIFVGDGWLSEFVPKVVGSPQYQSGDTLLVITWDENDGSPNNHIVTLMLAKSVVPGTRDVTPYTHYSMLRTTQELLGLPLLGAAATAPSMRAGFNLG